MKRKTVYGVVEGLPFRAHFEGNPSAADIEALEELVRAVKLDFFEKELPKSKRPPRVYVVAGNQKEASQFAEENQLGAEGPLWRYVSRPQVLYGLINPHVEWVGTYARRPDLSQIRVQVAAATRRVKGGDGQA